MTSLGAWILLPLGLLVFPAAATTSKFSNSAYYVFHTTSRANAAGTPTPLDITCGFDNAATQNISCWVGDSTNFIYGNATATTAIHPTHHGLHLAHQPLVNIP